MRIVIGCDISGLPLKEVIARHLREKGIEVVDLGVEPGQDVDYPDIAEKLAGRIAAGEFERGMLFCGTGIGMAIAANKLPGVRAAVCHDPYSAERSRKSNNAQVATMGALVIGPEMAKALTDIWLASEYTGGRSARKVEKVAAIDEKYRRPTP